MFWQWSPAQALRKALLYDPEKGVLDSERRLYGPELEQGGRSDGEGVYRLTVETAARLLERNGRRKGEIAAIGLCGTWHSLMVCDGSMAPAAPVFPGTFPERRPSARRSEETRPLRTGSTARRAVCPTGPIRGTRWLI